ncbi:MAG: UDP-N-acetylmuramoyl-L-alanine--D-glutamate ligase [Bacteroidota bacterium]
MSKKVSILGAGESGIGAAILAQKEGYEVWVSDAGSIAERFKKILTEKEIPFEEGEHTKEKFFEADMIVKSPGIPEHAGIIQEIRGVGGKIISEIEFASLHTDARLIAITGSNGKTTTTSLIWHLLNAGGIQVGLAGNIGKSFAWQVAEAACDAYVLEISSFQLDDVETFKPEIALLLNITPDHLDRYNYSLKKYGAAKMRIAENQEESDTLIYWMEDTEIAKQLFDAKPISQRIPFSLKEVKGSKAWVANNHLQIGGTEFLDFTHLKLIGRHNQLNALAALLAVEAFGVEVEKIKEALCEFKPVEHRLEWVAEIEGVRYINDSKATNVDAVAFALEAMDRPLIWMAGGVDKGNDYSELKEEVEKKVKGIVVLGEDKGKFEESFNKPLQQAMNMNEGIALAAEMAKEGDTVLLSPACASFDLFKNYEDRGRQFKEEVLSRVKNKED